MAVRRRWFGWVLGALVAAALILAPVPSADAKPGPCDGDEPGEWSEVVTNPGVNPITRAMVMQRARSWINTPGTEYCTSLNFTNQYGTYRRDCSGFVSMAWGLQRMVDSGTLGSDDYSIGVALDALREGDALRKVGHIALFVGWTSGDHTTAVILQESASDANGNPGPRAEETTISRDDIEDQGFEGRRYRNLVEAPPTPTGTITTLSGAAGTGRVQGTVALAGSTSAIQVRAVVGGVTQPVVASSAGAFDAPFTIPVTSNPPICVQASNGTTWTQLGTCRHTAMGWSDSMTGGPSANGRLIGVARVPGWSGTLGVRAVVNDVPQPAASTTGGGTDYQPFSTPFALTGPLSSKQICLQGNSYGYWHPMGPCRWTATGTVTGMTGTSGSGTVTGTAFITNWWDYPIQLRVTVDGVIDPNSYRHSNAGTGNRPYSAPFTASATAAHTVCVQANSHGYWTQLGCRTRPRA